MPTSHDILRERLLRKAGVLPPLEPLRLEDLERTEWSPEFEELMRNRLIMGALRYGRLNAKGKPKYDRVGSIKRRADLYAETGNLECLVDLANEALCEFVESEHPAKHFDAADDGYHTKPK